MQINNIINVNSCQEIDTTYMEVRRPDLRSRQRPPHIPRRNSYTELRKYGEWCQCTRTWKHAHAISRNIFSPTTPPSAPPPNSSASPNRPSTRISRSGWRRSTPRSISRCGSCSTATRPSGTSAAAWRRGENTKVHNPDRGTSFRKNRGYYRRR